MKKIISFSLALLLALVLFTACDPTGNDPLHAELRLVPITTGDLAKAVVDERGNQYLPTSELSAVMAKAASADIDFGNMTATRTLQYVLMNVGNTDVYDITFVSSDLKIHPMHIPLIPTQGEGGDLIALPIVSFIKEHVIPLSGVGTLLEMETGIFTDVMTLCYNYDLSHSTSDSTYIGDSLIVTDTVIVDSFDIADEYTVAGAKAGAIIEIWVSGVKWEEYGEVGKEYDYGTIPMLDPKVLYPYQSDTIIVKNTGNVAIPLILINSYLTNYDPEANIKIIDTMIQPGAEIDLSDKLRNEYFFANGGNDLTRGNILILGAETNQPYIFSLLDKICTTGALGLRISEYYTNPR